jgi:microcin C transport system ATP-binding protein
MGNQLQGLKFKAMRPHRRNMQIVIRILMVRSPRMSVYDIVVEGLTVHQPKLTESEREKRVTELRDAGTDPRRDFAFRTNFPAGNASALRWRAVVLEPKLRWTSL